MGGLCECGCGLAAPIAKRTNTSKGHTKGAPVRFIQGHSSAALRERVAAAKRGRPRDAETRAKISAALKGRTAPPELTAKRRAMATRREASPTWIGDAVSYNGAHNRARLALPDACAFADATCKGRLEVALRRDAPAEFIRVSARGHTYYCGTDSAAGYYRLCVSHHRRYDE